MRRVGFIGLGRMGLPMAQNLAKAGYEVLTWNRTPKEAEGLVLVGSPKEAAGTGLVITMLADDAATDLLERRFTPPGFALRLGLKDVRLIHQAADTTHTPMPLAHLLLDRMLEGVARGIGEEDWAAVLKVVEGSAGIGG
ncbi:NAD(P)-binding domain-containing protein [Thermus thermophilus]|uniref:NAD(P)-binding domain-containing protein n=1 Tax=Thermus thermophilus TaxID=274 RepID=UPI0003A2585D|nr:NAD(P)-binding domain-containing protein [Thermus thermophilus]